MKITAEFQSDTFVPPPRTIDDVTAILDREKPDPAKAEANRKAADAAPGAGLAGKDLVDFYYRRSLAARELGRFQQQVADLKEAIRLDTDTGAGVLLDQLTWDLVLTQRQIGDAAGELAAVEMFGRSLAANNVGEPLAHETQLCRAYARLGDFADAEKALSQAEARLDSLRRSPAWPVWQDAWTSTLTVARASLSLARGDFTAAESDFRTSVRLRQSALGTYDDKRALSIRNNVQPPSRETFEEGETEPMLGLADVLRQEGKLVEAEVWSRRALLLLLERRSRYSLATMEAVTELASILSDAGRYHDAERLGQVVVATYEGLGAGKGSWPLDAALSLVGSAQAAQSRWRDAEATFRKLEATLGDDTAGRDRFVATNLALATVYLETGQPALALPILERAAAERARTFGADSRLAAEARGLLGAALYQSGQASPALSAFDQAVPVLLRDANGGQGEDAEAARNRIARRIFEADMAALEETRGAQGAEQAFGLVDAAHGEAVRRALAESTARAAISDPGLADLVRRYQDARMRLTALETDLADMLTEPTGQQDQARVRNLQTATDELGAAETAIRKEIALRFPDYARLIDPPPPDFADVRKSLKPGEALVATHTARDRIFVWAVPKNGVPAFAVARIGSRDLAAMVESLRRSLNPEVSTLGDIPPFDVTLAHKLYAALLAPVESGWKGAKTLIVVPDGALTEIPWALLVTQPIAQPKPAAPLFAEYKDVPFLIRQVATAELPSVSALATLRALPPGGARQAFVGFGDPWFNASEAADGRRDEQRPQPVQVASLEARGGMHFRAAPATETLASAGISALPRLPDTAEEVREIAESLRADPATDVFLGAEANETRVRTMRLDDRRVVMFATHGLVPGDLDGLTEPALALTPPSVAGGGQGNGLLTLDKILALKLDADWVVLSACNTGAGSGGAGAEAVSGLGRAFFYAGARALLVTNWPVETVSARLLTTGTFRHQAEAPALTRAEALRRAALDLLDGPGAKDKDGRVLYSYAHPIFWAPYSLVGDGG